MYPIEHVAEAPSDGVCETAVNTLSTLASKNRIAILRALATAEKPLTFTELCERVSIGDTGRFNYYL